MINVYRTGGLAAWRRSHSVKGFELISTTAMIILVSACGSNDSRVYRSFDDDKALETEMVAAFMANNQELHIRDWEATYLQRGSVDPVKAGRVADERIKAAIGCFDWVNQDSGYESKMNLCIYFVGPSTRTSNQVQLVWGDRNRVENAATQDDFQRS